MLPFWSVKMEILVNPRCKEQINIMLVKESFKNWLYVTVSITIQASYTVQNHSQNTPGLPKILEITLARERCNYGVLALKENFTAVINFI